MLLRMGVVVMCGGGTVYSGNVCLVEIYVVVTCVGVDGCSGNVCWYRWE